MPLIEVCPTCALQLMDCICTRDTQGTVVNLICRHLDNTFCCLVDCECGHPCCAHTLDLGCMAGDCDCLAFKLKNGSAKEGESYVGVKQEAR